MDIKVSKEGERWIARFPFSYETKDFVKDAGFRFSPSEKLWYTTERRIANRLISPELRLQEAELDNQAIQLSRATNSTTDFPCPKGLSYLPYQKAGIEYLLGKSDGLLADAMGLGKTIQAIGVINTDEKIRRVLIVCPATLKLNWKKELDKWLIWDASIAIVSSTDKFPDAEIVIINYDILLKYREDIDKVCWSLLIVDEAHYAKNGKAKRTQAIFGKRDRDPTKRIEPIKAKRRIFITGTPIVNRPAELWTLVQALDPNDLGSSFMKYHFRYCNARSNGYGWDFTGASNLEELQQKLRSKIMVRRLKEDVLKELPAKRRQVVLVPPNGATAIVGREKQLFDRYRHTMEKAEKAAAKAKERGDKDGYNAAIQQLRTSHKIAFEEMAKVRHDTAVAKIPYVIDHLTECLEQEDKVVVFAHHHDVIDALKEAFPNAAVITGRTKVLDRQGEVDRFQKDPNCHLFIGGIKAAGVGITLTAAQLIVFVELDWVPGNISQAEDRLHRIGQKGSVLVQHLVFDDSVDSYMADMLIEKQETIEKTLDRETGPIEAPALLEQQVKVIINAAPPKKPTFVRQAPVKVSQPVIPDNQYKLMLDDEIPF